MGKAAYNNTYNTYSNNACKCMAWLCSMFYLCLFLPAHANNPVTTQYRELSPEDAGTAIIAFVNLTTAPGVDSASFRVDTDDRDSDLVRSSLGFGAEFTFYNRIYDGYWGAAIGTGTLDDRVFATNSNGEPVEILIERSLLSARGTFGLSFPITQRFKLRPYGSLIVADLDTKAAAIGEPFPNLDPSFSEPFFDSSAESLTGVASLEAVYDHWWQKNRLELTGQYNLSYTDTFSSSNRYLDTHGWSNTALVKLRLSGPTAWESYGRSWRWVSYINHTSFLDQEKFALGFTNYFEVGVGLDYEWNIKPLNWFGLRTIGLKAGALIGDDMDGYTVGLTFR